MPFGTVLTLPATGSEMNSGAVITNAETKGIKCDHCAKTLRRKKYLQQHVKIFHNQVKDFHCSHWPKSFGRKTNLS